MIVQVRPDGGARPDHFWPRPLPGVYAVDDVTSVGTPKAGVFAEGAARVVASEIIAKVRRESMPPRVRRDRLLLQRVRRQQGCASGRRLLLHARKSHRHIHVAIAPDIGREGRVRRHAA